MSATLPITSATVVRNHCSGSGHHALNRRPRNPRATKAPVPADANAGAAHSSSVVVFFSEWSLASRSPGRPVLYLHCGCSFHANTGSEPARIAALGLVCVDARQSGSCCLTSGHALLTSAPSTGRSIEVPAWLCAGSPRLVLAAGLSGREPLPMRVRRTAVAS